MYDWEHSALSKLYLAIYRIATNPKAGRKITEKNIGFLVIPLSNDSDYGLVDHYLGLRGRVKPGWCVRPNPDGRIKCCTYVSMIFDQFI